MTWQNEGKCRTDHIDMFVKDSDFRDATRGKNRQAIERINQRIALCNTCPVLDECHTWAVKVALSPETRWGGCIIGGATAPDINREAAALYRPDCGTSAGYRYHLDHGEPTCDDCKAGYSRARNPNPTRHYQPRKRTAA